MLFIHFLSISVVPLMITFILANGLMRKAPVFELFMAGTREGMATTVKVLPTLIGLVMSISMLRESGFFEIFSNLLSPVLSYIHFPPELIPLALIRPISGSGGLAVMQDLIDTFGPDSFLGRATSVMMGSTETTFYTIAVYFGSVQIKNIRHTLPAAIIADIAGILASVYAVRLMM